MQKTSYSQIDIFKFLLSFVVVGIHCNLSSYYEGAYNLCQSCVSIFFALSGFLMAPKLFDSNINESYLRNSIVKMVKLYIIWSIIYMPLTIYGLFNFYEGKLVIGVFDILRRYLLVGDNYMSWVLWYMLAIIVSLLLFYFLYIKLRLSFSKIIIISLFLVSIGYLIKLFPDCELSLVYRKIFVSTRNGFFNGFSYFCLGLLIFRYNIVDIVKRYIVLSFFLWLLSCWAVSSFSPYLNYYVSHVFVFFTIALLLNLDFNANFNTIILRKLSVWIFFSHLLILFLLRKFFLNGDLFNWILASFISLVLGIVIIHLSNRYPKFGIILQG